MNKQNLIVFDIDGTLTDSVQKHQKAFKESLLEIGVEHINTAFKSFKHHTDSYIAKEIYENSTNHLFSSTKAVEFENRLIQKISAEHINEIKGAKALIEHLNSTNYGICYATGSLLRPAQFKLESIGINYDKRLLVASDNIYEREHIVSKAIKQTFIIPMSLIESFPLVMDYGILLRLEI